MNRAELFGCAAAALLFGGVLVVSLLLRGRRRPAPPLLGAPAEAEARLVRLERALFVEPPAQVAALRALELRVAALEARQPGTAPSTKGPPQATNPGMGQAETALLAVVNQAWDHVPEDRAAYPQLAQGLGLPARFYALRDIDHNLQTLWDDTFTFTPSDDEGGWLLCEDGEDVLALPADPAFFRFSGVLILVRRMFDGMPPPGGAPRAFVRAYHACRLRMVEPHRYKLIERGLLLVVGEPDGGWPQPLRYEDLTRGC